MMADLSCAGSLVSRTEAEAQKVWAGFSKQADALAFAAACNAAASTRQASRHPGKLFPAGRMSTCCPCVPQLACVRGR